MCDNIVRDAAHSLMWLALIGVLCACSEGGVPKSTPTGQEPPVSRAAEDSHEWSPGSASGEDVRTMSTPDLVETVISHPKMIEVFVFSSPQQGFNTLRQRFEPLAELLRRQDAGAAMLARYQAMQTEPDEGWSPEQVGGWLLGFQHLELILAQDQVMAQLDEDRLCELLDEAREKLDGKRRSEDVHGTGGKVATIRLMGRVLQFARWGDLDRLAAENDEFRLFLDEGGYYFSGVADEIVTQSESVLSERCTQ